ncbi:MAG: hypothetical protein ACPHER_07025, partial [Nevskiales bacterium]
MLKVSKCCLALLLSSSLLACSNNDNDDDINGRFVDGEVSGLQYSSTSYSGTTGSNGDYICTEGEFVSFSLGSLALGTVPCLSLTTPLELYNQSVTGTAVTNLGRLLQSLDEDGNPANGINITPAVSAAMQLQEIDMNDTAGFESALASFIAQYGFDEDGDGNGDSNGDGDCDGDNNGTKFSEKIN